MQLLHFDKVNLIKGQLLTGHPEKNREVQVWGAENPAKQR
jgi:hypothetical protein